MIIQCKQCATKFRFSDELMTGDGVWVRCGRCGHEFFEINTRRETFVPPREPSPAMREAPPAHGGEGPPPAEPFAWGGERTGGTPRDAAVTGELTGRELCPITLLRPPSRRTGNAGERLKERIPR